MNPARGVRQWMRGAGMAALAVVVGLGVIPAAQAEPANGTISGKVTLHSGKPAVGAKVCAVDNEAVACTKTHADGRYRITGLEWSRDAPYTYEVTVTAPGYLTTHFTAKGTKLADETAVWDDLIKPAPNAYGVNLQLLKGVTLRGKVTNRGKAVPGTLVTTDGPYGTTYSDTGENGRYSLVVPPGTTTVYASGALLNDQWKTLSGQSGPLKLKDGKKRTVNVAIELGTGVTGVARGGGRSFVDCPQVSALRVLASGALVPASPLSGGNGCSYGTNTWKPGTYQLTFTAWKAVPQTHTVEVTSHHLTVLDVQLADDNATYTSLAAGTPIIYGVPVVGQELMAAPGKWTPSWANFTYQWYRDGQAISGANWDRYTPVAADLGKRLTVTAHGNAGAGLTADATSAASVPVRGILTTAKPVITGKAKVGKRLTVRVGRWAPAPVALSYTWRRSGKVIVGATQPSYQLTKQDKGKRITVTVTGTRTGYLVASRVSVATKKVVG